MSQTNTPVASPSKYAFGAANLPTDSTVFAFANGPVAKPSPGASVFGAKYKTPSFGSLAKPEKSDATSGITSSFASLLKAARDEAKTEKTADDSSKKSPKRDAAEESSSDEDSDGESDDQDTGAADGSFNAEKEGDTVSAEQPAFGSRKAPVLAKPVECMLLEFFACDVTQC